MFVKTGAEESVANDLRAQLDINKYLPFLITKEYIFRKNGTKVHQRKLVFPGYVFMQTGCSINEVINTFRPIIDRCESKIFRILNYGSNKEDIMIRASEQTMWSSLVDSDFCISASKAIYEEGKLKVVSGSLLGKENRIKHVNRYRQKAIFEVEFAGEIIQMSSVLKIVDVEPKTQNL